MPQGIAPEPQEATQQEVMEMNNVDNEGLTTLQSVDRVSERLSSMAMSEQQATDGGPLRLLSYKVPVQQQSFMDLNGEGLTIKECQSSSPPKAAGPLWISRTRATDLEDGLPRAPTPQPITPGAPTPESLSPAAPINLNHNVAEMRRLLGVSSASPKVAGISILQYQANAIYGEVKVKTKEERKAEFQKIFSQSKPKTNTAPLVLLPRSGQVTYTGKAMRLQEKAKMETLTAKASEKAARRSGRVKAVSRRMDIGIPQFDGGHDDCDPPALHNEPAAKPTSVDNHSAMPWMRETNSFVPNLGTDIQMIETGDNNRKPVRSVQAIPVDFTSTPPTPPRVSPPWRPGDPRREPPSFYAREKKEFQDGRFVRVDPVVEYYAPILIIKYRRLGFELTHSEDGSEGGSEDRSHDDDDNKEDAEQSDQSNSNTQAAREQTLDRNGDNGALDNHYSAITEDAIEKSTTARVASSRPNRETRKNEKKKRSLSAVRDIDVHEAMPAKKKQVLNHGNNKRKLTITKSAAKVNIAAANTTTAATTPVLVRQQSSSDRLVGRSRLEALETMADGSSQQKISNASTQMPSRQEALAPLLDRDIPAGRPSMSSNTAFSFVEVDPAPASRASNTGIALPTSRRPIPGLRSPPPMLGTHRGTASGIIIDPPNTQTQGSLAASSPHAITPQRSTLYHPSSSVGKRKAEPLVSNTSTRPIGRPRKHQKVEKPSSFLGKKARLLEELRKGNAKIQARIDAGKAAKEGGEGEERKGEGGGI